MVLALWHFEIFKYRVLLVFVFFLFYIHYTNLAFADYQPESFPGDNYISPLQNQETVQDIACDSSPDLLDIEIFKVDLSTQDEDIFEFYVEMTDLQIEPGDLSSKWVIRSPSGSIIRQPVLRPDQWGTYLIRLVLEDGSQNCKYTEYIFQYPEVDTDDLEFEPSMHVLFEDIWIF